MGVVAFLPESESVIVTIRSTKIAIIMSNKTSSLLKVGQNLRMSMAYSSGDAGAIRGAGGAFSKKEAAEEERYFRKIQYEQLKKLKKDEMVFHRLRFRSIRNRSRLTKSGWPFCSTTNKLCKISLPSKLIVLSLYYQDNHVEQSI